MKSVLDLEKVSTMEGYCQYSHRSDAITDHTSQAYGTLPFVVSHSLPDRCRCKYLITRHYRHPTVYSTGQILKMVTISIKQGLKDKNKVLQ